MLAMQQVYIDLRGYPLTFRGVVLFLFCEYLILHCCIYMFKCYVIYVVERNN